MNKQVYTADKFPNLSGVISFPAIRGVQAGREFYTAMVPFKQIPRIFIYNEYEVPPDLRAQRNLNTARIPRISEYIINNPNDYVFSALTASIDGDVYFSPYSDDNPVIGTINISMNARLLINDGQHRRAAIEAALKENPGIAYETIPIVFFVDLGLKKSQQMFADLNKNAVRPSRSLSILYNIRDPIARNILSLTEKVDLFKGKIELEKTSISKRSTKLFTLSALYSASKFVYDGEESREEEERKTNMLVDYWNELSEVIKPWKMVKDGDIRPWQFRADYVCSHGILLDALGGLAKHMFINYPKTWKKKIQFLKNVNWYRDKKWEGIAMEKGVISKTHKNIDASIEYLKSYIGE